MSPLMATEQSATEQTETKTGTSPADAFTVPQMRAVGREDVWSEQQSGFGVR